MTYGFLKNADSYLPGLSWGLGFCMSNKLLGNAYVAAPQTSLRAQGI